MTSPLDRRGRPGSRTIDPDRPPRPPERAMTPPREPRTAAVCEWCGAPLESQSGTWTDVANSGDYCPEGKAVDRTGVSPHLPRRPEATGAPLREALARLVKAVERYEQGDDRFAGAGLDNALLYANKALTDAPAPAPLDVEPGPGPGCDHVGPIESMAPAYPEKYRCVKCYGSVWPLCECGDPLDSKVHGSGPHRHAYEADLTARAAATEDTE